MKSLIIICINFIVLSSCYSQKLVTKIESQGLLEKSELAPYLDKNDINLYNRFFATGNYAEINQIKIGIVEAYANDSIVQLAFVFKSNTFQNVYRIGSVIYNSKKESYAIGRVYTENCKFQKDCLCIYFEKIEPFRTDTLDMKFTYRMTKLIQKDSVSICK